MRKNNTQSCQKFKLFHLKNYSNQTHQVAFVKGFEKRKMLRENYFYIKVCNHFEIYNSNTPSYVQSIVYNDPKYQLSYHFTD